MARGPDNDSFGGIRAEIQVRTTAQHIWGAASHTLQYKNEAAVPPAIRRAIHRVSALLETVDLEFERVLSERDAYRTEVAAEVEPEEVLNVDLLRQVLDETWPQVNRVNNEDYASVLEDLEHFQVRTRKQLSELFKRQYKAVMTRDHALVEEARGQIEEGMSHVYADRIAKGIYLAHSGLTRVALGLEFGKAWDDYAKERFK